MMTAPELGVKEITIPTQVASREEQDMWLSARWNHYDQCLIDFEPNHNPRGAPRSNTGNITSRYPGQSNNNDTNDITTRDIYRDPGGFTGIISAIDTTKEPIIDPGIGYLIREKSGFPRAIPIRYPSVITGDDTTKYPYQVPTI